MHKFSIALLFGAFVLSAVAQAPANTGASTDKSVTPSSTQKEKKVAAGEKEVKRLLLLMDKDNSGKVSKQEFMNFMEAEFARLDKNNDGELDVKELTQMQVRFRSPAHR